jgi:hypothetical protein
MRWIAVVLGVAVSILFWAPAAQAQGQGPTLTVTPSTGLVDGQTVTLIETGFFSFSSPRFGTFVPFAYECVAGKFPVSDVVDISELGFVTQQLNAYCTPHGQFAVGVTTLAVSASRQFTTTSGTPVQCGTSSPSCVVLAAGAAQSSVGFVGIGLASAPISFAPPTPRTKDNCKDGGWRGLADNHGNPFPNQGQCIAFVKVYGGVG